MTVAASKKIRALLAAAGYGRADVSVRNDSYSMGSSVHVTIKRAEVPLSTVEKIASEGETVYRDDATGEILGGGNCFVHTRYADGVLDLYAARINAQVATGRTSFGPFTLEPGRDPFTLRLSRDGKLGLNVDAKEPGNALARELAADSWLMALDGEPAEVAAALAFHEHALEIERGLDAAAEPPCECSPADAYECLACNRKRQSEEPESFAPVVSIDTPLARASEVAAEMFGAAPAPPLASAQLDARPFVPSVITLARPDGPVYSLDEGATGERLAARVVRAAERWQAAFPCPAADEPRLRALWLAVERLIAHDESL